MGRHGFDVAFECVGVEPTITAAVANIQKGGTIVVVGVFGEKPRVDLGLVQDRELNLRGTLMYKREDYVRAVELIAAAMPAGSSPGRSCPSTSRWTTTWMPTSSSSGRATRP